MSRRNSAEGIGSAEARWVRRLTASAFLLAGCVAVLGLQRWHAEPAEASVVVSGPGYTVLSANTRDGEESVFFLDGAGQMIIYRPTSNRKGIEPVRWLDIGELFGQGGEDTDGRRGGRSR
ncbi:MAG: hypothetical protein AAGA57_00685 [Planctomycetota bacterium]